MEDEERLKEVINVVLRKLQVAQNQYKDLWDKLLEVYPYLEPEAFESNNHWFLKVPEPNEEADLQLALKYLNRYEVLLDHMIRENSIGDNWRQSLEETKHQVATLTEILKSTLALIGEEIGAVDEVDSLLPEELKNSGRSARLIRDCLFVKDYKKLLVLIETIITRFAQ